MYIYIHTEYIQSIRLTHIISYTYLIDWICIIILDRICRLGCMNHPSRDSENQMWSNFSYMDLPNSSLVRSSRSKKFPTAIDIFFDTLLCITTTSSIQTRRLLIRTIYIGQSPTRNSSRIPMLHAATIVLIHPADGPPASHSYVRHKSKSWTAHICHCRNNDSLGLWNKRWSNLFIRPRKDLLPHR